MSAQNLHFLLATKYSKTIQMVVCILIKRKDEFCNMELQN